MIMIDGLFEVLVVMVLLLVNVVVRVSMLRVVLKLKWGKVDFMVFFCLKSVWVRGVL